MICFLKVPPIKTVYTFFFLPMRATSPIHCVPFDLIPRLDLLWILNHGAPHYVIFCTFLLFHSFRPMHLPQRLTLQLGSSLSMRDQISLKHIENALLLMKLACRLSATEICVEMGRTLQMFVWWFTVSVHRFLHSPTFSKSLCGADPNWIATALDHHKGRECHYIW